MLEVYQELPYPREPTTIQKFLKFYFKLKSKNVSKKSVIKGNSLMEMVEYLKGINMTEHKYLPYQFL